MKVFVFKIMLSLMIVGSCPLLAKTKSFAQPKAVLIIGDSMLWGNFGETLHSLTSDLKRFNVYSVSSCAARGEYFTKGQTTPCGLRIRSSTILSPTPKTIRQARRGKTPTIFELMEKVQPSYMVIQLGLNYGSLSAMNITKRSTRFLETIFRRKNTQLKRIIWIGPPHYKWAPRINEGLRGAIFSYQRRAYFVDGTGFNRTNPLPTKNPHFGSHKAEKWAEYVFPWVKGQILLSERTNERAKGRLRLREFVRRRCSDAFCLRNLRDKLIQKRDPFRESSRLYNKEPPRSQSYPASN